MERNPGMDPSDLTTVRITTEPVSGGVRIVLPPRPGGPLRTIGILLVIAALVELAFVGLLLWIARNTAASNLGLLMSLFGVTLLVAAALFWVGATYAWGRTEVLCTEGRLKARQRWRWLTLSQRVPNKPPIGLEIRPYRARQGGTESPSDPHGSWSLVALYATGPTAKLAADYPREWLVELVRELKPFLDAALHKPVPVWDLGDTVSLAEAESVWLESGAPVPGLSCEKIGKEVHLQLHPTGWHGLAFDLLLVGSVFVGIPLLGAALTLMGVRPSKGGGDVNRWEFWVGFGFMFLTGLALCLFSLNQALRRVTLVLDSWELRIQIRSLLRTRNLAWQRPEIAGVSVGPSSIIINGQPLPELKIALASGKVRGLLAGTPEVILRWIAVFLQRELKG
jgi:hypothetical protein